MAENKINLSPAFINGSQNPVSEKFVDLSSSNFSRESCVKNKMEISNYRGSVIKPDGINPNDLYVHSRIKVVCDIGVLLACGPFFYGLCKIRPLLLLPWIFSNVSQLVVDFAITVCLLELKSTRFEPATAFVFTTYFFFYSFHVYATIGVLSIFKEWGKSMGRQEVQMEMAQVTPNSMERGADDQRIRKATLTESQGGDVIKISEATSSVYPFVTVTFHEESNDSSSNIEDKLPSASLHRLGKFKGRTAAFNSPNRKGPLPVNKRVKYSHAKLHCPIIANHGRQLRSLSRSALVTSENKKVDRAGKRKVMGGLQISKNMLDPIEECSAELGVSINENNPIGNACIASEASNASPDISNSTSGSGTGSTSGNTIHS